MLNLYIRLIFITLCFLPSSFSFAELNEETSSNNADTAKRISVKTLDEIKIIDNDASSVFDGVSSDAAAAGLKDTVIHGSVESKPYGKSTRMIIKWHTLEKQKFGENVRQKLEAPLTSSLIISLQLDNFIFLVSVWAHITYSNCSMTCLQEISC